MAENLRHPLEGRLFQETKKVRAIRDVPQGDFQCLVANLAPMRGVMGQAMR